MASADDVAAALAQRAADQWTRTVDPVTVLWHEQQPHAMTIRVPAASSIPVMIALEYEDGGHSTVMWTPGGDAPVERADLDGTPFAAYTVPLPGPLPVGYHLARVQSETGVHNSALIVAPEKAYTRRDAAPEWGIFAPLYSIRRDDGAPTGTYADLRRLGRWVRGMGGSVMGTLPLLASVAETPYDPSPYAPVSRLFWNELYIELREIPELERTPEAGALMAEAGRGNDGRLVDYEQVIRTRRPVLEALAAAFFADPPDDRRAAFEEFVRTHPEVEEFAQFMAVRDRLRTGWQAWPERLRQGTLVPGDYDEAHRQYHRYCQWIAEEQVRRAATEGAELYLDLPLGVSGGGYDTWRRREAFAHGVAAGAPPDTFFTLGQNWGFPPLQPHGLRARHYGYLRSMLQHHLRFARFLRIDHVMGLFRLFWVPDGMQATEGVYVSYPAQELLAVVSIESHRAGATVIGEDLGTVPNYVREAMHDHDLFRMYVGQYEVRPGAADGLVTPPRAALASLNTHDMPTFAGWWNGVDIPQRIELGLLDDDKARQERDSRERLRQTVRQTLCDQGYLAPDQATDADVMVAWHAWLAGSPAAMMLVNLEDLWLERDPQNVPGTVDEHPNWRRRMNRSLEAIVQDPEIARMLEDIARRRAAATGPGPETAEANRT